MALDPRSIIGEILSRRPDLRRTYAPQAQALGVQIAGLKPAVEARRRLETANAWRAGGPPMPGFSGMTPGLTPLDKPEFSGETRRRLEANKPFSPTIAGMPPTPPPTGFPAAPTGLTAEETALPFSGTGGDPNSLRSMADRGDPSQAPGFRSRLNAAMDTAGVQLPGPAFSPQRVRPDLSGYLGGDTSQLGFPASPGNLPRPRPFESMIAARPEGPPSGFPAAPPLQSMVRPEGPPGSLPAAPLMGGRPFTGSPGMASRFGDQSQLASGAFSGAPPRPPSTMPGSETFAPPSQMATRFNDPAAFRSSGPPAPLAGMTGPASPLAALPPLSGDAFSRPPSVAAPSPIQPNSSVATRGGYQPAPGFDQALGGVPASASLPPLSPQAANLARGIPNPAAAMQALASPPPSPSVPPLQSRGLVAGAPLDLAAGIGAPKLPLGSTNLPFAAIPPTPASVAQRTEILGPLPPGAGTGAPVRSVQTPLIVAPPASGTVPPVGPVPGQDLPAPPPVGVPPSLASVGPPNPARMEVVANYNPQTGQRTAGTPRGKGASRRQAAAAPAPEAPRPFWNAPNIGTVVGAGAGLVLGGGGGAVAGAAGGRVMGKIVKALRNRGQNVDAQGNILDEAGNIIGHVSDMMGNAGRGLGGIFGGGGSSVSGGNWGSNSGGGFGGWGGGGQGGSYGGYGGSRINEGIGGAFRNR